MNYLSALTSMTSLNTPQWIYWLEYMRGCPVRAVTTRKKKIEQTSSLIGSKLVKFRNQELVKPCHEQHTQFHIIWNEFSKTFYVIKTSQLCFFEDRRQGGCSPALSCTMQKAEFPGHCEVVTVKVETLSAPFVLPFPILFLLHKYTVHLDDDSYESIMKVPNASQFLG